MLSLIGIVIVIIAAYYATYYIGVKASGRSGRRPINRSISILDRFAISKDKSFCVIEIAGKVYIVGITNQTMTLLDTLDASQYAEAAAERRDAATWPPPPGNPQEGGFFSRFLYYMSLNFKKKFRKDDNAAAGNTGTRSGTFADSMRSAQDKNDSDPPAS